MPDKIKKLVRARMAKTGESYQTALRRVRAQAPTNAKMGESAIPTTYEVRPCRYFHVDPTKYTQAELLKRIMLFKVYETGKLVAAVRARRPEVPVAEEEGADLRVDCASADAALRKHLTDYFAPKTLRFFEHGNWHWNDNGTYEEMHDPALAQKPQAARQRSELDDERYVRELFADIYGVELRKVPESKVKTFDYELLSKEQRVAALEVKRLGVVPRTPENGWVRTQDGFMTRPAGDNGPSRVGEAIHKAYKQLATATEPKVLVLVNDEHLIDLLDLDEAVNGYLVYGNDQTGRFKNPSGMRIAEGRIKDEKLAIDLYVWINRYEGRTHHRADGQPLDVHSQRGPFFRCTSDAGYEIARKLFKMPEAPKPERDSDADVPTLQEMLLRQAGIKKKN